MTPAAQYGWDARTRAALKRRIREKTSQAEFARLAGMSASNLSHLLAGESEPGISKLAAVAIALGTTIDSILMADDGRSTKSTEDRLRSAQQQHAVASAEAIAVAIDCLPVGKDIRTRLMGHVQAHIELLRRIGGDPA